MNDQVLVVSSESAVRAALVAWLEARNLSVASVSAGADAVDTIARGDAALVLYHLIPSNFADMGMFARIRETPAGKTVSVIGVVATADMAQAPTYGSALGIEHYVTIRKLDALTPFIAGLTPPVPAPDEPVQPTGFPSFSGLVTASELQDVHLAMASMNHFEVLGVDESSNNLELKRAYMARIERYNLDCAPQDGGAEARRRARDIYTQFGKAYQVLRDRTRRAAYIARLRPQETAPADAPPKKPEASSTPAPSAEPVPQSPPRPKRARRAPEPTTPGSYSSFVDTLTRPSAWGTAPPTVEPSRPSPGVTERLMAFESEWTGGAPSTLNNLPGSLAEEALRAIEAAEAAPPAAAPSQLTPENNEENFAEPEAEKLLSGDPLPELPEEIQPVTEPPPPSEEPEKAAALEIRESGGLPPIEDDDWELPESAGRAPFGTRPAPSEPSTAAVPSFDDDVFVFDMPDADEDEVDYSDRRHAEGTGSYALEEISTPPGAQPEEAKPLNPALLAAEALKARQTKAKAKAKAAAEEVVAPAATPDAPTVSRERVGPATALRPSIEDVASAAYMLRLMGQYDRAVAMFAKCLEVRPNARYRYELMLARGLAAIAAGDIEAGTEALQSATESAPKGRTEAAEALEGLDDGKKRSRWSLFSRDE